MKAFTVVLLGSLAANAVLVGALVIGSAREPAAPGRAAPAAALAKSALGTDAAALSDETWTALHSDDLTAMRDRLRAAGFPPELVRAILAAQLRESFAARRKALEDQQGETPFWKNPVHDPKVQAALRDLGKEQEKILKDLLGHDGREDDPSYAAYLRRQFGDLPADKVDQLRDIQDDFNRQRSDIFSSARNGLLPEEQQKISVLDKAMHAEFAKVLTPDELADYDLHSSSTAEQLRSKMAAFDASEDEYKAIFALQQTFDEKWGRMYGPSSPEDMKARMDAQKQLTEDVKTALGPDRGADYVRDTDYSYRQTSQLVARLALPPETAASIWAVQQDVQAQQKTLFTSSPGAAPGDRMQTLNALQQDATAKITALLGGDPSRVEVYKQNGGQWLQYIAPRPTAVRQ